MTPPDEVRLRPRRRSVELSDYASARDFFAAVFDAEREHWSYHLALERAEAREGVRAQTYEPRGRGGGASDRTAATDARMELEAAGEEKDEENVAMVRLALEVIYGRDGHGGVEALMGRAVALALDLRYAQALSWGEVASRMERATRIPWSVRQCQRKADEGIDCVDAIGWERCIRGEGDAT